jgi:hypothetical protein
MMRRYDGFKTPLILGKVVENIEINFAGGPARS